MDLPRPELAELDEELQRVAAMRRRRERLQRDEHAILANLSDARDQERAWDERVKNAREDLRALEGLSLTSLLSRLTGDRDEKIAEEQQELVRHKLRRDEARAALAPLAADLERTRDQIAQLGDLDQLRQRLLDRKEELLLDRGGEAAERLVTTAEELGRMIDEEVEVTEAECAGLEVVRELDAALEHLGSARSWGTFDMLGGGLIATMCKHGGIDRAQPHIERAQQHLRRFERELRDVDGEQNAIALDITQFLRMADYFFDGLIVDWMVQSRIVKAIERAAETRRTVRQVVLVLAERSKHLTTAIETARRDRRRWLEAVG